MFILMNEKILKVDQFIPEAMVFVDKEEWSEEEKNLKYRVHLLEHSDEKTQFTVDAFDLHRRLGCVSINYIDKINRSNRKMKILNLAKLKQKGILFLNLMKKLLRKSKKREERISENEGNVRKEIRRRIKFWRKGI